MASRVTPVWDWDWDDAKVEAFDCETSGKLPEYALQPWRIPRGDAWITSASCIRMDPARQQLVPSISQLYPTKDQLAQLLERVIAEDVTLVGWNIAYDISLLIALGLEDLAMRVRWLDGMLLWRHLEIEPEYEFQTARHKRRSYALKPAGINYWLPGVPTYNDDVDFHATDPDSLARLQHYNDKDNVYTFAIARMVWQRLAPSQRRAALVEAQSLPVVAQANVNGLRVDQLTTRHLCAWLDSKAANLLAELEPDGVTEKVVRSPKQLAELLFDKWQLPVLKENKSKVDGKSPNRSTDKEVLHELAFIDARVAKVKEYRQALNAKAKFGTAILESVAYNEDGRTHPISSVFSTYTGRMTVASKQGRNKDARPIGFALHQMMRGEEYRESVTVDDEYDIVEFDAAAQEYRWMAIASGDSTMLGLCRPGEDAHSFMGARIVGMEYAELRRLLSAHDAGAKQTRYLGKFANLSLQYRTSARKLRVKARTDYDIPMELPEAQRIHHTYQQAYPGVPVYWRSQIALVRACGYVETFAGRRVQVKGNWDGEWGWSMGSTAINTRIQGTGADQKYLAIACIKDYLAEIGAKFLFELHDGLYIAIPRAIREKAVIQIKHILDNLPYQEAWGFSPPIPLPWDCKVGRAWGRMTEVNFQ